MFARDLTIPPHDNTTMVLENATASNDSSSDFTEAAPSSDIDPYASDVNPTYASTRPNGFVKIEQLSGAKSPIYVNLNNFPKPLFHSIPPPIGPNYVGSLSVSIQQTCKLAQIVLKRPISQDEADAFAFHLAKAGRIGSYGEPLGVVAGTLLYARNYEQMKFPFVDILNAEGSRFRRDSFASGRLKGSQAVWAWQIVRGLCYNGIGMIVGGALFGAYALSVGVTGRVMDPRLKEFHHELKQKTKEGTNMTDLFRMLKNADGNQQSTTQPETYEMMRQRKDVQENGLRRDREQKKESFDDMSPTGGAFDQEFASSSNDGGILSDHQVQQEEKRQEADELRRHAEDSGSNPSKQRSGLRQVSDQQSLLSVKQEQQGSKPMSAWEKLRQANAGSISGDAAGKQSSWSQRRPGKAASQDESNPGDSFSFDETDEQRHLARSEAQKEFDMKVEREREGLEFEDSAGPGRRRR